ncbi:MAG: hypothetical protein V4591_11250 [Bdellovibrionota bacterium]
MSITNNSNLSFISEQAKSSSRVGHDILSYCTRCKMNLTHTIVTLDKQSKPARVLCNTCKTERQYTPKKLLPKTEKKGGLNMERDEEVDLDLEAGAKLLISDDVVKKKSKAKAKPKKTKEESELSKASVKNMSQLPLSMLEGTPEDRAQYDARLSAQKNNISSAKEYKATLRFKTGDIINHKTFGIGFVVAENGLKKIEVLFPQGRKLLATGL